MSEIRAALQRIIDAQAAIDNARPDFTTAQIHELQSAHVVAQALLARPEPDIDHDRLSLIRQTIADLEKFSRDGATWGASADIKFLLSIIDAATEKSRPEPEPTREEAEQLLESWYEQRLHDRYFKESLNTSDHLKEACLAAMLRPKS